MLDRDILALYEQRSMQAIVLSQTRFSTYCGLLARSILRDEQDVIACVGATWTRAWDTVPFDHPANLKLYLGKIARSLAIERLTANQMAACSEQLPLVLAELGEIASPGADPSAEIGRDRLVGILGMFLSGLCERDCGMFIRRYYYVEDIELIARRFCVTRAQAESALQSARQGLRQAIGRTVYMQELLLLDALGEMPIALIERAEQYKPRRPFKLRARHVVLSVLVLLATFLALSVAVLCGISYVVWETDAYLQQEYGDYDGTLIDAFDILLTRNENWAANMLNEQQKESLHGVLESKKPDRGALFVLHGSQGLTFKSFGDGTCAVSGLACTDSHVLIPSVSPDGDTVVSIAMEGFEGNRFITEVTIPWTVTDIGYEAFKGAKKLTKVYMPDSIEFIGEGAFADCKSLSSLEIPMLVSRIDTGVVAGCIQLKTVTVSALNPYFYSEGNCLIHTESQEVIAGWGEEIVIPEGVQSIRDYALHNHATLKKITFPQSLCVIRKNAFENCDGIESIVLPDSMNGLGDSAFANCDGLVSVSLPLSVDTLDPSVLANCNGMTEITIPGGWTEIGNGMCSGCYMLTRVEIKDGVSVIGRNAFKNCASLSEIVIPCTVEKIEQGAFDGCGKLSIVYYTGSEADWAQLMILVEEGSPLKTATVHCNYAP